MKLYELEEAIMNCWSVCDDLETVYKQVGDGKKEPTTDETVNALLGMKQLYHWKFEQLFNEFENLCEEYRKNQ